MRFSENRRIAYVALAMSVIISIFGFGGLSLTNERKETLNVFYNGSDTTLSVRHSVDAYLDLSADAARLMASEGERYLDSEELISSIRNLANKIGEGDDLEARFSAYNELKSKTDQLYNLVYDAENADFTNFKLAYDDFWGYENMIKFDDYHKQAQSYNKLTQGFPAKIVSEIWKIDSLDTFGG